MRRSDYPRESQPESYASEKMATRSRTYYFDIKEAKTGKPYLVMTEIRYDRDSGRQTRSKVIVYPEDIRKFTQLFESMARELVTFADGGGRKTSRRYYDEPEEEGYEEDEERLRGRSREISPSRGRSANRARSRNETQERSLFDDEF